MMHIVFAKFYFLYDCDAWILNLIIAKSQAKKQIMLVDIIILVVVVSSVMTLKLQTLNSIIHGLTQCAVKQARVLFLEMYFAADGSETVIIGASMSEPHGIVWTSHNEEECAYGEVCSQNGY